MKRTFLAALCVLPLLTLTPAQAQNGPDRGSPGNHAEEQRFIQLADRFLQGYLKLNPESATALGDHRYDGKWSDLSTAGIKQQIDFNRQTLTDLRQIPQHSLSAENRVDYDILKSNLEGTLWMLESLKELRWNPMAYNPGSSLYLLVARDFAPLDVRLKSLAERLDGLPVMLDQARANLQNPPRVDVETAISQNKGTIALVEHGLDPFLQQSPSSRALVDPARQKALAALRAYGTWLETDLLPRAHGNFRLGPQLYAMKLKYTLESNLKPAEVLSRAKSELVRTHQQMDAVAVRLYPRIFPHRPVGLTPRQISKAVLDKISERHPNDKTVLSYARNCLAEATDFVARHHIVTLPTETVRVTEMPEFNRGIASAYCDSPGPLEAHGETFFAIAPTPADWTRQRVASFYREYNNAMMHDLTVHEAMPGHFLQLMHADHFHAPTRIRTVFQSGTFVEGWATYAEQVMANAGFGGPEVKMEMLKMHLRLILNAILDAGIHSGSMTEDQAKKLMMNEGFQEEGEAAEKWHRACVTSCQLSTYFVGNLELNDLSRDYRRAHPQAKMQQVHDHMLMFGSPAPRYVRRLLGLPAK